VQIQTRLRSPPCAAAYDRAVGKPKKKWGQNFLRNRGAVEKIVAAVEAAPGETIVEIGPGEGVLTGKLLELPNRVVAVEIDPDLAAKLRARFGERLELRHEDAVDAPMPEGPFRAVGNLPYNVGTPILRRVIADANCRRAVFMLQKEVADRVVAKPGSEPYGYLTLYVQAFASAKSIMTLEPKSFFPPPKVRSAVVVLDPRDPGLSTPREEVLDLVSTSFRMRRKKLVNNLTGWRDLTREQVLEAMRTAAIDENARAETLALTDFDRLAGAIGAPRESRPSP
jgi:16S rRNA (adenine1518-N6/adenine1519-N6)-dimethyltransferase